MRVHLVKFQQTESNPPPSDNAVILVGQHGSLLLDEWEAREVCGMLPHVLDPITEDKAVAEPPE